MVDPTFEVTSGSGSMIATAIHDGHELRADLQPLIALSDAERLREEDPFTGRWVAACPTSIIVNSSRFQVDLNRPREVSVYRTPGEAWGLMVWKRPLSDELIARALAEYDAFYARLKRVCDAKVESCGRFVVFDLHSYNYQRSGPGQPEDPRLCPDINLGTGSVPAGRSREPIERCLRALRQSRVGGRELDVRENVKFRGGYLARWVHEHYPERGLCLAIEVKKFFMDEWTGTPNEELIGDLGPAFAHAASAVERVTRLEEP
jgi:N-formylglutamate deformylase